MGVVMLLFVAAVFMMALVAMMLVAVMVMLEASMLVGDHVCIQEFKALEAPLCELLCLQGAASPNNNRDLPICQ